MTQEFKPPVLNSEQDFERRLGLPGSKYTATNSLLTFSLGLILATAFYVALSPFTDYYFAKMFLERGPIPYAITLFAAWSMAILFVKSRKVKLQRKALGHSILPESPGFVLSPITAEDLLRKLYEIADNPKRFLLLNRIERALSNLRNIGRVSDVDEILRSQADNDENFVEATYTGIKGFIWAIPVLGFIGTVLGLSSAIGNFGQILSQATELEALKTALQGVTGGLAVAFETTLIGLVAAVGVQLLMTSVKHREEVFLDECNEYCHRHIVSRLRTIAVDEASQEGDSV